VVVNARSRAIVGVFAAARVAIGIACAVAPRRLSGASSADAALMTRSFAVRELVLGVGGLLAVTRAQCHPTDVRVWAGLGALTDGGDLCAAVAGLRDGRRTAAPAVVAALGLVCESWAYRAAPRERGEGASGDSVTADGRESP